MGNIIKLNYNNKSEEKKFKEIHITTFHITFKGNGLGNSQSEEGSTWSNFWKKFRILTPFLWPKKDIMLQLKVIICIFLLIAGRIINLLVPLYHKYIGKTSTSSCIIKLII